MLSLRSGLPSFRMGLEALALSPHNPIDSPWLMVFGKRRAVSESMSLLKLLSGLDT